MPAIVASSNKAQRKIKKAKKRKKRLRCFKWGLTIVACGTAVVRDAFTAIVFITHSTPLRYTLASCTIKGITSEQPTHGLNHENWAYTSTLCKYLHEIHTAVTICDKMFSKTETSKRRSRVNLQRNACFMDTMVL